MPEAQQNIAFASIENKIIHWNETPLILDKDVATLYGVETKRVNEAVANNPDKFPEGYILTLNQSEWDALRSKNSTLKKGQRGSHTKYIPKAFTEKGLYMLATILKGEVATKTTLNIIETFARIRSLKSNIREFSATEDESIKQSLMQKSGKIISELFDEDLKLNESETTIEFNLALIKLKHTVRKNRKNK
jgi:hypothetical protein